MAWAQEASGSAADGRADNPFNAVVKLEVETVKPNVARPWICNTGFGMGSGVIIGIGKILTCAHCVADASFMRIRKQNDDRLYHATLLFEDDDADLALVRVEDPEFMSDITPLEIGETPHVQSRSACRGLLSSVG